MCKTLEGTPVEAQNARPEWHEVARWADSQGNGPLNDFPYCAERASESVEGEV